MRLSYCSAAQFFLFLVQWTDIQLAGALGLLNIHIYMIFLFVVLPNCSHSMCLNCYKDWHDRSQSCPFCRDSLEKVDSSDLWIYIEQGEIAELSSILRENRKRLFTYIDRLPLIVPDPVFAPFDVHVR
ncbi:hypothetical protein Gogos_022298 [Gossypium gossypioides]|uniref:RING-type domain-containing protein n=1 Tax=Gossypium gossypioides TaxID=34282 RepID=A0A7J9CX90_GOSGO|nr:hypothetical protein [Gossypium gossypioides]